MATLYELTNEYVKLMEMLCDPEADEESFREATEAIKDEIRDKADGYAKVMKNMDADINALKEEEARLKGKREALENGKKRLKENLEWNMRVSGETKFKTTLFNFYFQKNPPSVVAQDEKAVISELQKNGRNDLLVVAEPKLNKTAIKEAIIKDGEIIDGVEVVQGESLRIR